MIDEENEDHEIVSNEAEHLNPKKVEDEVQESEAETESAPLSQEETTLLSDGGLADAPSEAQELERKYKEVRRKLEKERRESYRKAHQNTVLQQELEAANERARLASEAANFHYASNADQKIAAAEQKIRIAKENGDVDFELEGIKELQRANYEKAKSDDYRYQTQLQQEAYQQEAPQQQQVVSPYELNRDYINDWVEDNNEWLNPRSTRYDNGMVTAVDSYMADWNQRLEENGLRDHIGSPEYFQVLNQKISEATQNRRQPQMKQVQRAGAPVRGVSRAASSGQTTKLSRDAQEMMNGLRNYGIKVKDEDLVKHLERGAKQKAMWGR